MSNNANINAQMTNMIREFGLHEVAKAIKGCIDTAAATLNDRFELLDEFNVADEDMDYLHLRGGVLDMLIEHSMPAKAK